MRTSTLLTAFLLCVLPATLIAGEIADLHRKFVRTRPGQDNQARSFDQVMSDQHGITEIGLERTPCFGDCPVYSVVIKSDGSFRYHGMENVKHKGRHIGMVDQWNLRQLCHFIRESGYMQFSSSYSAPVTDLPTAYTTVVMNGKRKVISHYADVGPLKLWMIEQAIDKLMLEARWGAVNDFDAPPAGDLIPK